MHMDDYICKDDSLVTDIRGKTCNWYYSNTEMCGFFDTAGK